jgi:hypothetical protein
MVDGWLRTFDTHKRDLYFYASKAFNRRAREDAGAPVDHPISSPFFLRQYALLHGQSSGLSQSLAKTLLLSARHIASFLARQVAHDCRSFRPPKPRHSSREQVFNNHTLDVCQAEIAPGVTIRQAFVVEAQQMQERRM